MVMKFKFVRHFLDLKKKADFGTALSYFLVFCDCCESESLRDEDTTKKRRIILL